MNDINWGMVGMFFLSGVIWYCIFTIGFFHTLLWMLVGALLGVIIIKIKEKRNDYTRYLG